MGSWTNPITEGSSRIFYIRLPPLFSRGPAVLPPPTFCLLSRSGQILFPGFLPFSPPRRRESPGNDRPRNTDFIFYVIFRIEKSTELKRKDHLAGDLVGVFSPPLGRRVLEEGRTVMIELANLGIKELLLF